MIFALLLMTEIAKTVPSGEEPLVDLEPLSPRFLFDIRYATRDNFVGKVVYPEARCLLRESVAARMVAAQRWLDDKHPGHRLLFKDCYRPDSAQRVLWDAVKGTPKSAYVANPGTAAGSMHSYGAAVDLTLADEEGREIDMGTIYDFLGPLAEPRREAEFLASGELQRAQVEKRHILRDAMRSTGMRPLPHEWWHYDAWASKTVRAKFSRLDVAFASIPRKKR